MPSNSQPFGIVYGCPEKLMKVILLSFLHWKKKDVSFYAHKISADNLRGARASRAHIPNPLDSTPLSGLLCLQPVSDSDQTSSKVFALMGWGWGLKLTGLGANTHVHSRNQMSWLLENSKGLCCSSLSVPLIHSSLLPPLLPLDLLLFLNVWVYKANTLLSWPACCGRL